MHHACVLLPHTQGASQALYDDTMPLAEHASVSCRLVVNGVLSPCSAALQCYQSEAEQQRLQGQAQLLMDCVADMLTHEGLDGLRGMTASE